MKKLIPFAILFSLLISSDILAQRTNKNTGSQPSSLLVDSTYSGLKMRNIGPGFMSGRIADIAIDPEDHSSWFVAVGSGGVWKTVNSGTT